MEEEIELMQLPAKEHQGSPGGTRSWKRQGRIPSPIYPQLQREHGSANALISDFWPPEV